jgi:GrpB-like predicted nucleotidyltransferase (UPF0157 family)
MVELIIQDFEKNKETYKQISNNLKNVLGTSAHIDHVGSAAIPNMLGKNIIDILVGFKDKCEYEKFAEILYKNGYFGSTNSKTEVYQFFASSQNETKEGDVHIHLAMLGNERYNEFIILKNYLLSNKNEALAYSNYKNEILSSGITDRKQYRKIKSEYVTKLIKRAKNNSK